MLAGKVSGGDSALMAVICRRSAAHMPFVAGRKIPDPPPLDFTPFQIGVATGTREISFPLIRQMYRSTSPDHELFHRSPASPDFVPAFSHGFLLTSLEVLFSM